MISDSAATWPQMEPAGYRRCSERMIPLPTSLNILCVDNDPKILALRAALLSIAGYEVLTAIDSESALQVFEANCIDLVITEYFETGDWEKLAGAMKMRKPEVPILLYTLAQDPPEGFPWVDQVLVKGMNPPEFLSEVAKLITKSQG
jgi:DNA-binding NtrC family response regulator